MRQLESSSAKYPKCITGSKKMRNLMCGLLAFLFTVSAFGAYKSPNVVLPSPDGKLIYVLCHDSGEILTVSTDENKIVNTIGVAERATGMCVSEDGAKAYVTSGESQGKIQVVSLTSGLIEKEIKAGHSPNAPIVSKDGKRLFVCNRYTAKITEYALPELTETRKYDAIREPCAAALTPDGKTLFVLNHLPNDPADSFDVASNVTCIDTENGDVKTIRLPNGSGSLLGICVSPDGRYVFVTEILARYQMPTTQLERGWINTNAISILDAVKKEFINAVLLDDIDLGASNPWGIAITPDCKQLAIAVAGTHEIITVDVEGMLNKLSALPKTVAEAKAAGKYDEKSSSSSKTSGDVPNDLAFLVGLKKRIKLSKTDKGPRAIAFANGKYWTGMYFADTLVSVDANGKIGTLSLGPKPEMTAERRGESNWNDATMCFQQWLSCASCHPDARVDAYNWDLLNDGMGNPKNAKSMLYGHLAPPAMWHGVRASSAMAVGTGFKHILFSVRSKEELDDTEAYIVGLNPVPSPYLVDGKLSEAAQRGKAVFENPKIGCASCHYGEQFTDKKMHDVGSKAAFDRKAEFDTPQLNEVWRTGPYMHDGRFVKMPDVFKIGKHGDVQGDVEGLSDSQIEDLAEYVLSL